MNVSQKVDISINLILAITLLFKVLNKICIFLYKVKTHRYEAFGNDEFSGVLIIITLL